MSVAVTHPDWMASRIAAPSAPSKRRGEQGLAVLVRGEFVLLFIYLIMTADIEKNNLLFRHLQRQADAVTVGNAHRV